MHFIIFSYYSNTRPLSPSPPPQSLFKHWGLKWVFFYQSVLIPKILFHPVRQNLASDFCPKMWSGLTRPVFAGVWDAKGMPLLIKTTSVKWNCCLEFLHHCFPLDHQSQKKWLLFSNWFFTRHPQCIFIFLPEVVLGCFLCWQWCPHKK